MSQNPTTDADKAAAKAARDAAKEEMAALYAAGILIKPEDGRGNTPITPSKRAEIWNKAIAADGMAEIRLFGITKEEASRLQTRMATVRGIIAQMEKPDTWTTKTQTGNLDKEGKFIPTDPNKPAKEQVFTKLRHGVVKAVKA